MFQVVSYSTKFVSFNLRPLLLVSASKSSFIDKLGKLLLDEIVDFFHRGFETFLGSTSDVKI